LLRNYPRLRKEIIQKFRAWLWQLQSWKLGKKQKKKKCQKMILRPWAGNLPKTLILWPPKVESVRNTTNHYAFLQAMADESPNKHFSLVLAQKNHKYYFKSALKFTKIETLYLLAKIRVSKTSNVDVT
jgi:hypothetical protein